MFFCQEMRAKVKEENPDLSAKEITIKLGEMWKEIKETEEAEKYNQLAVLDKDRYKEEMENYVPTESASSEGEGEEDDEKKTEKKGKKDRKEES